MCLTVAQDRLAKRVQAALASAGAGGGESSSEAGDSRERERVVKKEEEESHLTNPELRGMSTALLEKVNCMLLCTMCIYANWRSSV